MNSKKYHDLCIKSFTGNISAEEDRLLKELLLQSNYNQKKYEEIKNIWLKTGELEIPELPDKEMEWNKLQDKIELAKTFESENHPLRKTKNYFDFSLIPRFQPVVVGILFLLTAVTVVLFLMNERQKVIEFNTIVTQNSETQKIKLQDGSTVILNNGSKIEVPSNFSEEDRTVNLEGEAFFEIVKNTKPFIIITDNAKVRVLGTKFNVWARDEKTKVIVKEGRVNLLQKETATGGIEIASGFSSAVVGNNKPAQPIAVDAEYLIGWINNKLVFEQARLVEIIEELERLYNKNIILGEDSLKNLSLTGTFNYSNINTTLEMICLALDLKYENQNGSYIIKAN